METGRWCDTVPAPGPRHRPRDWVAVDILLLVHTLCINQCIYVNIIIHFVRHYESKAVWVKWVFISSSEKSGSQLKLSVKELRCQARGRQVVTRTNLPFDRNIGRCCIWNAAFSFQSSDKDIWRAINMFPTIFPDPSNICNSKTWISRVCVGILFNRPKYNTRDKNDALTNSRTVTAESDQVSPHVTCPRSRGVAAVGRGPWWRLCAPRTRTSSFGAVVTTQHGLASWGWQGFSLRNLIGSFISQSSASQIVVLCTGQFTSDDFTQDRWHWVCCYMQFIGVAAASWYFTGGQKPLSFLKLCSTGHVSSCLLTKQGYKPLTLKKPKPLKFWKYYFKKIF